MLFRKGNWNFVRNIVFVDKNRQKYKLVASIFSPRRMGMRLRTFIIRRALLMIPTLIGVTLLIFAITQMFTPEQRAASFLSGEPRRPDVIPRIIQTHHLDDPIYIQYYHWMSRVLQGDLGFSSYSHLPVLASLLQATPATIELVMFAIPITIIMGVYLGVVSAVHRDTIIDHATRFLSIIGWSLPTFWLALILLAIFYGQLNWVSAGRLSFEQMRFVASESFTKYTGIYTIDGILNGQLWITLDALKHLILPVITLTIVQIALIVRVMRSSMLEALGKGYTILARAKGLSDDQVVNKHARRNALIPIATLSGILAAGMLTGVVITETCFNYMGLGHFAANAAMQLDIPGVLGFSLFTGIVFVIANLLVDIIYVFLDPRMRLG